MQNNLHLENMLAYLHIKPSQIERATQIIQRDFSSGWLGNLSAKYKKGEVRSLVSYHPIYHGILSGIVNPMTLDVIELANYLDYLRKALPKTSSELLHIVHELKSSDKFYSYLFQLMVSARFCLVSQDFLLEPKILNKQPDMRFRYLATEFVIETTRPNLPMIRVKLEDLMERVFFSLEKKVDNKVSTGIDIKVVIKNINILKRETELRKAIKQLMEKRDGIIYSNDFDASWYKYTGTVNEFQSHHQSLAAQGKELAFVIGKTNIIPFPPRMDTASLKPSITLVVDLSQIEENLLQDVADKIDIAAQEKIEQLRSLMGNEREIYIFIDIGAIATAQYIDVDRILPRLNANIFNKYPGALSGIVLAKRVWDDNYRRYRLAYRSLFSPGNKRIENYLIFRALAQIESRNDFITGIVGWVEAENVPCPCLSGKVYKDCCIDKPVIWKGL